MTDRQTDRDRESVCDRQTDKQTDRDRESVCDRQTDRQTERDRESVCDRQTDRKTDRQRQRESVCGTESAVSLRQTQDVGDTDRHREAPANRPID